MREVIREAIREAIKGSLLLDRLQLAFDDIDLAIRCGLRIFGDPLGGARRGARHLMMEAITEAIAHNGTSAAMFAVRTSSNQRHSRTIKGDRTSAALFAVRTSSTVRMRSCACIASAQRCNACAHRPLPAAAREARSRHAARVRRVAPT
jgi:hypothetical protein